MNGNILEAFYPAADLCSISSKAILFRGVEQRRTISAAQRGIEAIADERRGGVARLIEVFLI